MTATDLAGRNNIMLRAALKRLLNVLGLHAVYDVVCMIAGWLLFRRTGVTPRRAHASMVSLFCQTAGASNDLIHRLITVRKPLLSIDGNGVLGVGHVFFSHDAPLKRSHGKDGLIGNVSSVGVILRLTK